MITVECTYCGKAVEKEASQLKYYRKPFCNRSCAASYNNNIPKRKKEGVQLSCLNCGAKNQSTYVTLGDINKINKGEKPKRNGKFCSNQCQHDYGWKKKKELVLKEGIQALNLTSAAAQDRILKLILIEEFGRGETKKACWKCGWEEANPFTGKSKTSEKYQRDSWRRNNIPTQLSHIDGDPTNQSFSNLEILCPNCHSLTEFHGSRGKGGRTDARGNKKSR